ncbi:MAG: ATP-binding domain-containing protein, partial [Polyangiales bacterium]
MTLTSEQLAIVAEEEAILARARQAILTQARPRSAARDAEPLRALREEAKTVAEDDLPNVLHELAVQHRLASRPASELPDPEAPYLAHFRVEEDGRLRDYLLGRTTWIEGDVRIVDWRVAPVARIFYAHREGEEYEEELPGRTACGTVTARRLVAIEHGRLVRVQTGEDTLVREGDTWRALESRGFAEGGSGRAVRSIDVTASLDAEQWGAIQASEDLLVLGSAGSGKTTVALHRLSRLGEGSVIVPEEGLARLSRRLLAPLGSSARVRTLDQWAEELVRAAFALDRVPIAPETPGLVVSLKRHPATFAAITKRVRRDGRFRTLRRKLHELFTDASFLTSLGHSPAAVAETVRHTRLQMVEPASRALAAITDREAKRTIDGRGVVEDTPDELGGTVDREDLPIFLALHPELESEPTHLVVDEAEDASLFELDVLGRTLEGTITLAGDEAQQTTSSFAGWERALAVMGVEAAEVVRLPTSYRCPRPIAELARKVLGALAPEVAAKTVREGPPVARHAFPRMDDAFLFVADAASTLARNDPRASIGILARDEETAARLHPLVEDARLVRGGAFDFAPGIEIADVDSA